MKNTGLERVANRLKPLLKKGIETKVFSGAAAGIYQWSKKGEKRLIECQGKTRLDTQGVPIRPATLFDLASLTKPLCTVLSLLCLLEKKKVHWQSRLDELLSYKLRSEYKRIYLNMLLSHSSGLAAYKPFYSSFRPVLIKNNKPELIRKILAENLEYDPGTSCVYSDLGFILLGEIIENISQQHLDNFFEENITLPLQLERDIHFRSLPLPEKDKQTNIAATEKCPWRGRILQGEVHDEHCWLMGGVAGHAGLFGTIGGVLTLVEHLLHQWQGREEHPGYSNRLLRKALTKKYPDQTWCLGFDTPSAKASSGGSYLSAESVGHLGYTGTSFWVDRQKDLAIVLLTNRVYPTRKNEGIKEFRPLFHNTVIRALEGE